MMTASLKRRVEVLEGRILGPGSDYSAQFDADALAIYSGMAYLDATMDPTYHEVEPTAIYARGEELRNKIYGPIIPAHLDQRLKRYTKASGEFELAFGREPKAGDVLCYQHLELTHSPENLSSHFGKLIAAWQRQLPHLPCPLKFEIGGLFRRLRPERRNEPAKWEEDFTVQPEIRWLKIPEVISNTDIDAMLTIPAVVFLGVIGDKHRCRPAIDEELQAAATELPSREPTGFMYGNQRFCELLVEVMGA